MLIPSIIQANAQPPLQLVPFSTNETTVSEGTAISSSNICMMACTAFASPHSIVLNVHPALKKISLQENSEQLITSTVVDEFRNPVANVHLTVTVDAPNSSTQYARMTGQDGTDHLRLPLFDLGQYRVTVFATNPDPVGGDATVKVTWTVTR
jgi:hypothetical protein